jgi:diguanylate cyclase (GGDEF)-like protein
MNARRQSDRSTPRRGHGFDFNERYLKTVLGTTLWLMTTGAIIALSFVPAVAPDNVVFWRLALGIPALIIGLTTVFIGMRAKERVFQGWIELLVVFATAIHLVLLQITPATVLVLYALFISVIYAGYFARPVSLALILTATAGVALSALFTDMSSGTPHLGSFLVVYIPTIVVTGVLLHLQNAETLGALDRTRMRALTDPLTGLANLRGLERAARRALGSGSADDEVVGLLLIDLDNFKSANSRYGHLGGDYALRMVATQMRRAAPRGTVIARVGGDEFAAIVRAESRARVAETGEIMRAAVRAAGAVMEMPGVTIDAAVGVAIHPDQGRDLSELLDAADKSMYSAKGQKRHVVPNLERIAPIGGPPPWIGERRSADEAGAGRATLDSATGGSIPFLARRTVYARTSALAWALGAVLLGVSLLMPDAIPDPGLPPLLILFGGLALSVGILFVNAKPQSKLHMVFDVAAYFGIAGLIALTGGLESVVPPLMILLVASQAWFWQTRMVVPRVLGPILVCASPMFYESLGAGDAAVLTMLTVGVEVILMVALVAAMYFNRWLLAMLQSRASELALLDPLTGVRNRRAFDDYVEERIKHQEHAGTPEPFAIVMIDLDNFKQVNTSRGHRAGDEVLIAIGAALESVAREDDCVARVGGDEFAAVLPGVGVDGARLLAERFVDTVSQTPDAREAGVGASAGFALYPLHGESLDQLVFTADSALMAVKSSGKGTARVARVISAA